MKKIFGTLVALLFVFATLAHASIIGVEPFYKVVYIDAAKNATQSAANSGRDYASAKGFFDGDLFSIPANVIVQDVHVIVDESVSGITAFNLGDDDAASGFVASSSPTFTADNLYFDEVDYKGSYLKGGATSAVSVNGKYYSATGKEVKLDVTGTASTGKMRVIIKGLGVGNDE